MADALEDLETRTKVFETILQIINSNHDQEDLLKELSLISREDVLRELEERYLTPRTSFPTSWLPKCQQYWDRDPDFISLTSLKPSKSRTTLEIVRDGPEGNIIGYKEVTIGESAITSQNSTSLLREPGVLKAFVRGKSDYLPFTPGGFESEVIVDTISEIVKEPDALTFGEDELLTVPPGFDRGLIYEDELPQTRSMQNKFVAGLNITDMITHEEEELVELLEPADEEVLEKSSKTKPIVDDVSSLETIPPAKDEMEKVFDSFLPTQPPLLEGSNAPAKSTSSTRSHKWAHVIDVNSELSNFKELVPEMARKYEFELDNFQKQAVYHLENGDSVFVAAHTSAGKTVVAEYAIALSAKHMTRAIYTSPIKALSNQKFHDFKTEFDDVGILTGDIQIKPEASCLIMTTEILRSMLYRGADLIRDIEFVIFDEVHYVNDSERGVVWEEVIIMLPSHVNLVLLSATVPNTEEFAEWIGTLKRPVPLEHYLYANKEIFKIVDEKKNFLTAAMKQVNDVLSKKDKKEKDAKGGTRGTRGAVRGYRGGGGGGYRSIQQDRSLWNHLISLLKKKELLPVVIFVFSKRKCNEYAGCLPNLDLCVAREKSQIHTTIERCLTRLKGSDKKLPQVLNIRELLSRGIAVHHGGLLPIIKELVEILFSKGLVKVLFATETFAMGINMPARTVVFSGIKKHDGKGSRGLHPAHISGEYTQMSGRAGRRGKDKTGVVIITCTEDEAPNQSVLKHMILGPPEKLKSQFRLRYNMILSLLRVEELRVEEMIKRSFSEHSSQIMLPTYKQMLEKSEKSLSSFQKLDCTICSPDIKDYYNVSTRILELNHKLLEKIMSTPQGNKALSQGRIVIINNSYYRNIVAVILKPSSTKSDRSYWVLMLLGDHTIDSEKAPLPVTRIFIPDQSTCFNEIKCLHYTDIAIITKSIIKLNSDAAVERDQQEVSRITQKLLRYAIETQTAGIIENDWTKIREFDFQKNLKEKTELMNKLLNFQCNICPDLAEHYGHVHAEHLLETKHERLRQFMSDQNLALLPDYNRRIEVLEKLKYINQEGTVELKGRVACEINSADELVLTELIFENAFADYDHSEIVALLSCFIFQERIVEEPKLIPKLEQGKQKIRDFANKVFEVQNQCKLTKDAGDDAGVVRTAVNDSVDLIFDDVVDVNKFNFGLVEVVYEWARGKDFIYIKDLTEVMEGSIVRCITRLDETCREVKNAARIVGDISLCKKMEDAQASIKRDIIFAQSLVRIDKF
ncbi:21781_t:CDS:10 [Gigaspora margarita]|uniref:21781_t:CDS:1 n=1 Tax=Gigaspora margarita TaxID=4874 RepID=A0ABM8W2Z1_GIGMA|nr:21781_t:CDS:10 [Gigaspora margarita]